MLISICTQFNVSPFEVLNAPTQDVFYLLGQINSYSGEKLKESHKEQGGIERRPAVDWY